MVMELSMNDLNKFDINGISSSQFAKGLYKVFDCESEKFVFRFSIKKDEYEDRTSLTEFLDYVIRRYQTEIDGYRKIVRIVKC